MKKIHSLDKLSDVLAATPHFVIAVDGAHGAGKTFVGEALAARLRKNLIDVDDFVVPPPSVFVESIDYRALAAAIASQSPALLASVCMRDVLANLDDVAVLHVYVKRMRGLAWTYDDRVDHDPLDREVREYHSRQEPVDRADVVFEWDESER